MAESSVSDTVTDQSDTRVARPLYVWPRSSEDWTPPITSSGGRWTSVTKRASTTVGGPGTCSSRRSVSRIPHGEWWSWLKTHFSLSRETAQRCITLAREMEPPACLFALPRRPKPSGTRDRTRSARGRAEYRTRTGGGSTRRATSSASPWNARAASTKRS